MTFLRTRIVVLEDTDERVKWLRDTFPQVDIMHCTDVVEFMQATRRPYALAILDHDLAGELGDSPEAKDTYDRGAAYARFGLSGMDAVRVVDLDTPVVVWSANPVWGPRMASALAERGVGWSAYRPFDTTHQMASVIREAYFYGAGVWLSGTDAIRIEA
jgi:hypothetical protein